jgi:alkylation response protein AidB-like acyl-CoA dehydrogenase
MIDLLPSAGDEAIIDSVRAYVTAELPVSRFREAGRTPGDAEYWSRFAELGWLSGADPAEGVDVVTEMLIFRELGHNLVSPALLATVLGAHLAVADGQRGLAAELMRGHRHVALAYNVATTDIPNYLYLIDARADSLFLTCTEDGLAVWDALTAQNRVALHPFDATTSLTGAMMTRGAKPIATLKSSALLQRARVLTAAMATGSAEATQKLAVDYAKLRHAFGRPIGSFQAIQHHCANMAIRSETARSQVVFAALCIRESMFEPAFQAAAAALTASEAAFENARICIQVHGGMGMTFDCEAHYHLKREHSLRWLWGGATRLYKQLLQPAALYEVRP